MKYEALLGVILMIKGKKKTVSLRNVFGKFIHFVKIIFRMENALGL